MFYRVFKLLEDECHALDLSAVAGNTSTPHDFSKASSPFREYHSKLQELSSLIATLADAQAQAESIEQAYTSASLMNYIGNEQQLDLLKNGALYYRTLMAV